MSVTLFPAKIPRKPAVRSHRLNEIAAVLGVPLNTFTDPAKHHVLHTSEDGTRWLLELNNHGAPVVRLDGPVGLHTASKDDIATFLAREVGSCQHQALIDLIKHLLVIHLKR